MFIKHRKPSTLTDNDVTPKRLYLSRRTLMASFGAAAFSPTAAADEPDPSRALTFAASDHTVDDPLTPKNAVTSYNNFYEFGTAKDAPARHAHKMTTQPWSITVEGQADNTGAFALEDVIDFTALEERIYRLRCVEAWSMVIPWVGVPLAGVLAKFEPTSEAKYVAFETYFNSSEMRVSRWPQVLDWPYVEGLRMDEAMNPLSFLAVGLYGEILPNQNGAPVRLVVPWKYGFKSIKSIVRIRFTSEQPPTSWNRDQPREYGFYSNVNPEVRHPRWSQASERVIGGTGIESLFNRRDTEMFNGYGDEVAHLYAGMDLKKFY